MISKQNVFALFAQNSFHYYSPIKNKWYTIDKKPPKGRLYHHIAYDYVNNVYLMCSARWATYLFKFSDVVGEFEGTGFDIAVESNEK